MTRPAPTHKELEAHLEAKLRKGVRLIGGKIEKLAPTTVGMPDRLILLPGGRMFLVELKATGGSLSAKQKLWHEQAAARGTRVTVLEGPLQVEHWISVQASYFDKGTRKNRL